MPDKAKRAFLGGCGCALIYPAINVATAQLGCSSIATAACAIQPSQRNRLSVMSNFDGEFNADAFDDSDLLPGSSNRSFDQAYGRVLNRLASIYDCRPRFSYLNDSNRSGNAWAVPHSSSNSGKGEVLFGINYLESYLNDFERGDMIILTISAHEFSHIKQFEKPERMVQLLNRFPCYYAELHADFVAGYGLAQYFRRYANKTSGLQEIGAAWAELGPRDKGNPGTHGTSSQRIASIEAGYRYARRNQSKNVWHAMSAGIDYLRSI